jgi:hypothetical protein
MRKASIQFIVEADEPALFFASRDAAETLLEAIDVEDGTYPIAFDRSGAIYDVVPRGNGAALIPRVGAKPDPERLRRTLQRFLSACGVPFSRHETLDDLLAKCEPFL